MSRPALPATSPTTTNTVASPQLRLATGEDLGALLILEDLSFSGDKLSRRSFLHWLKATNCVFLVAEKNGDLLGYLLVLLHKGTRLSRLYSLAVSPQARGLGIGRQLLLAAEEETARRKRLFMRLEVAKNNHAAIKLYESLGYRIFGEYTDYYEDHSDALRMQKRIRHFDGQQQLQPAPWYKQTTAFTCGPASLMMAMARLDSRFHMSQETELDIWREATTIFMTSGHGGCHPLGLALAANKRGYDVEAYINTEKPLFTEGVRSEHKKSVMIAVDRQFHHKLEATDIQLVYADVTHNHIRQWLDSQYAVLILISTYRMDGQKAPHWVVVTAMDDVCLYVHDPDPDDKNLWAMDCQHLPIAQDDFTKMSAFGRERLRTAIAIRKRPTP